MIAKINYKGRKVVVKKVKKCKSFFSKVRGLMFGNDENPLLFLFDKPTNMAIHSFFVRKKFIAIWSVNGKVIDVKVVKPWTLSVRPKVKFDMLLEIPFESNEQIFKFLVGNKKALNTLIDKR